MSNPRMTRQAQARFALAAALAALTVLSGCTDLSYHRLKIGQERREYERAFVEEDARRTDLGICYLKTSRLGRTDAIVLLLSRDQRVAARFQATSLSRDWGVAVRSGYRLRGEIDPRMLEMGSTGPVDVLRAVADELTRSEGEKLVRETHAWIAAGIVRLLQTQPHEGDEGPAGERLAEWLERVPPGGRGELSTDAQGVCRFTYQQGVRP